GHLPARRRGRLAAGRRVADRGRRRARADPGRARAARRRARRAGGVRPRVLDHRSTRPRRGARPGGRLSAGRGAGRRGGGGGRAAGAANGGATLFYVRDAAAGVLERRTAWLVAQPWAGALVAGTPAGVALGLLPGDRLGLAGPRAADIVLSFRWDSAGTAN